MSDILRSLAGTAGPRIAREAIKTLRWCMLLGAVAWTVLLMLVGYAARSGGLSVSGWVLFGVILPLPLSGLVSSGCETQIRHLNGLALGPYETRRMDVAGAKRMWIGSAIMLLGFGVFVIAVAGGPPFDGAPPWLAPGLAAVLMAAGLVLAQYKTGLALITPRGMRYDPDEDEFRRWW